MTEQPHMPHTVAVIDDDISVRESLEALVAEAGWRPQVFATAEEFLARERPTEPGCLVLDVGLPDLNGLELQQRIASCGALPIIFITGNGDIPTTVRAMKAGAVEFMTKPFGPETLLRAIGEAIEKSRVIIAQEKEVKALRERYETLTPREREVLTHVIAGRLNKQIAGDLGTVEKTVKMHRGRMMRKMGVRTVADLVRVAEKAGVEPVNPA